MKKCFTLIELPVVKKRGFTLIELLIVIAIIIIMAAVSVPAFQNYGAKSELSLKADEIKALIDRAEAYSKNPAQNQNCAEVDFRSDRISIQFGQFVGGTSCNVTAVTVSSNNWVDIPSPYITLTRSFAGTSLPIPLIYSYYPGKFATYPDLDRQKFDLVLSSTKSGTSKTITVTQDPYSVVIAP